MTTRIDTRFQALRDEGRSGLVTFICGGDPDPQTFQTLFDRLPEAGADVIEVGMPFSDPMADGPSIQAGNLRALEEGMTLSKLLGHIRQFRENDNETPLVLMGYYNPIYSYGADAFLDDAKAAGIDGLIIVDLPPEQDSELCIPAREKGLNFIRLATPTTDDKRLPAVLANTSGFLYYVSVTGITGAGHMQSADVGTAVARLKAHTDLPIAVGFGIKTPEQAANIASFADAAVVGSAFVNRIAEGIEKGEDRMSIVDGVVDHVKSLANAVRSARGTRD